MPRLVSQSQTLMAVAGNREIRRTHRRLRRAQRQDLQKALKEGISQAARPTARDITNAVRKVEVTSYQGGSGSDRSPNQRRLRQHISKNIQIKNTQKGVRIRVRPAAFPDYPNLPRYLDGELHWYKRWRHPIFDDGYLYNPDESHNQYGEPWFFVAIRRHFDDFQRELVRQLEEVAERAANGR